MRLFLILALHITCGLLKLSFNIEMRPRMSFVPGAYDPHGTKSIAKTATKRANLLSFSIKWETYSFVADAMNYCDLCE